MSDVLRTLVDDADRIHAEYRRNFAGRSRFTRDLGLLDRLIAETAATAKRARTVSGADAELLPLLTEREALYKAERDRIAALQAGGPDEEVAHHARMWSQLGRMRYLRNYAGHARTTRDLGLLQALAADQRHWLDLLRAAAARHDGDWHADVIEQLERNARLFEGEVEQIRQAQQGLDPLRSAQLQSTLANAQFDSWRLHFQDRPRRSRRPTLLRRMIGNLERIHGAMVAARDAGVKEQFNLGNIDNVAGRITAWKAELERIESLRAKLGPDEVAGALGDDANSWFSRFRSDFGGRSYKDIDPVALGKVCEGLQEVALAMEDHHATWRRELNRKNLHIVLENLRAHEGEFERVRDAHKPAKG